MNPDEPVPGSEDTRVLALAQDLADVREEMASLEGRRRRHWLWALVGVSPAAALPLVAALWLGNVGWAFGALLLMPAVEAGRALRAGRRARVLRDRVGTISEDLASLRLGSGD